MAIDFKKLKGKIESKKVKTCVIGLGYVGLPLALEFARKGIEVRGFDISEAKITSIKNGKSYLSTVRDDEIISELFKPSTDPEITIRGADVCIICVPTPLKNTLDPDLSYIISASDTLVKYLEKGMFVILESTTYPGTTEEILIPILERTGLKAGIDFGVAYSPERIDPGNKKYTIMNTPKIVGGINEECTQIAAKLYGLLTTLITVSSPRTAEMTKIVENVFRAVNIALVNELAILSEKMNIDMWEVVKAASTKPYGYMPFYPGPGVGGHCIPADPFYLSWKAKEFGLTTKFIELAGEINRSMPQHVVELVVEGLNRIGRSVKDSEIFILGAAYKKDINDTRDSPILVVLEKLDGLGARIKYNDDYVRHISINGKRMESSQIEYISSCDCLVIGVNHSYYDKKEILSLIKSDAAIIDCVDYLDKEETRSVYIKLGSG